MTGLAEWIETALGVTPRDLSLYEQALTHAPLNVQRNYQRFEFLGDRVLGLVVAKWLFEEFPDEREGPLSHRFMILVSGATCAAVAREIGVKSRLRLNKQGRDDGIFDRDNLLGDVIEALIAVVYLEHGFDAATAIVRRYWTPRVKGQTHAPRHPKSLLHEWADAHGRKSPVYSLIKRTGPEHAPHFEVEASVGSAGRATGLGRSKQEAETAAAEALLTMLPN